MENILLLEKVYWYRDEFVEFVPLGENFILKRRKEAFFFFSKFFSSSWQGLVHSPGFPLHFEIGGTFGLIPYFCTLNV